MCFACWKNARGFADNPGLLIRVIAGTNLDTMCMFSFSSADHEGSRYLPLEAGHNTDTWRGLQSCLHRGAPRMTYCGCTVVNPAMWDMGRLQDVDTINNLTLLWKPCRVHKHRMASIWPLYWTVIIDEPGIVRFLSIRFELYFLILHKCMGTATSQTNWLSHIMPFKNSIHLYSWQFNWRKLRNHTYFTSFVNSSGIDLNGL